MSLGRVWVEPTPIASTNTPAQTAVSDTEGLILAANLARKEVIIQNTGTTTLKLSFGTTAPTQTVYHIALKGCSAANDGSGGVFIESGWIGPIRAISSAAGGTCVILEKKVGDPAWGPSGAWGNNQ